MSDGKYKPATYVPHPRLFVAEIGGQPLVAQFYVNSEAAMTGLSERVIRFVVETWSHAGIDVSFLNGRFVVREATDAENECYRAGRLQAKEGLNPLLYFEPVRENRGFA